jgi:ubiquinone/menaquinone biosynthesis C-methylase UbiE
VKPMRPGVMTTRCCLAAWLALSATGGTAAAQAPRDEREVQHLHGDPTAYIQAIEDFKRDEYQKPHEVIAALGIEAGEIIADIGAGAGYFTMRLARHVGPKGRVYAVDVSPDMVRFLHARVRDMKLLNVSPILAPPDDPLLPEPVDRFLFVNVWHHIDDRPGYLARMRDLLKPGGQIVMIDFQKREIPVGPPMAMKIAREDLVRELEAAGFRVAKEHTFLPYQYFVVFERAR